MRKKFDLTENEVRAMEVLAGDREEPWGAWLGACIEFLQEAGLVTRGANWELTPMGQLWMEAYRMGKKDAAKAG